MNANSKINRGMRRLTLLAGGMVAFGFLSQCDESVTMTVFSGVESATTSLVSAFVAALFQAITPSPDDGVTTVQAVFDGIHTFLC